MTWSTLRTILYQGNSLDIEYIETSQVTLGVVCHIYRFKFDESRDLAIVEVESGCKTPLQRILNGEETIEGYICGKGTLTVIGNSGKKKKYSFPSSPEPVTVNCGDVMQWHADTSERLVFFELCTPPYEEGRFEDLPE